MKPFHVVAETQDRVTDVPPSRSGGPLTLLSHRPHRIGGSAGAATVGAFAPEAISNTVIPGSSRTFIAISQNVCGVMRECTTEAFNIRDIRWSMLISLEL